MKKIILLSFLFFTSCAEVIYLTPDDKVDNVKIQPVEALKIAEPFIEDKATYIWKDSTSLKTHIVMKGKYYYVRRTDYPAKTIWYYLNHSVRINSKNGKIKFIDK